jgi:hypothetical protein
MQERRELQNRQQKESRSKRALERELKSVGLYDESIFATDTTNSKNSLNDSDDGNPGPSSESLKDADSGENLREDLLG